MSVSDARLGDVDRQLDALGGSEAIARGERAAKSAGPLDLASVDAELARLAEGVSLVATAAPTFASSVAPEVRSAAEGGSALDVDSLFDDAVSTSELASLDGVGGDLGRSTTDRASRAPAEDSALGLADLLEGEELDMTDIAIELDET